MMLTPPDKVQSALIAAYLQVLLRQPEATMDVARSVVPIPQGYDLHRVSVVPSMMRARGLIRQTAVCRSRRGLAKCASLMLMSWPAVVQWLRTILRNCVSSWDLITRS